MFLAFALKCIITARTIAKPVVVESAGRGLMPSGQCVMAEAEGLVKGASSRLGMFSTDTL